MAEKKAKKQTSKKGPKQAQFADQVATVVKCGDYRYSPLTRQQLEVALGIKRFYTLSRLGAGQQLLKKKTRKGFLREIGVTLAHGSNVVVVIQHEDCAAYGGSTSFRNYQEERAKQRAQMYECAGKILKKYPNVTVVLCWHPSAKRGAMEVLEIIRPEE